MVQTYCSNCPTSWDVECILTLSLDNDKEYRRALEDWKSYVLTLQDKVIEADETIPELPFKDLNFRVYRDTRFSKNPLPYKVQSGFSPP